MMKYAICLFLCLFLAWEMIGISSKGMSDFRNVSVSQVAVSVGNASSCRHTAFADKSAGHAISDAILPGSTCSQTTASSKLLKLKVNPAVREILRSLHIRLSVSRYPSLSFTPNSIRYSCGYYIYTLAHILI